MHEHGRIKHRLNNGNEDLAVMGNEPVRPFRNVLAGDASLKNEKHDFSLGGRGKEVNGKQEDAVLPSRHASDGLKPLYDREPSPLRIDTHDASLQGRRKEVVDGKHDVAEGKADTMLKTVRIGGSTSAKKLENNDGPPFRPYAGRENAAPKRESKESLPYYGNPDTSYAEKQPKSNGNDVLGFDQRHHHGQLNIAASSTKKDRGEETPKLNSYFSNGLPPPYVKPNVKAKDSSHGAGSVPSHPGFDTNGISKDSSSNIMLEKEKVQVQIDQTQQDQEPVRYTELYYKGDDLTTNPIPKPRSSRRRHSRSSSGHDDSAGEVGSVRRKSRRRRDDLKPGLQILVEEEHYKDKEEERIIDKLLMHYSKKPSTFDEEMSRRKSKSRHAYHEGEGPRNLRKDGSDDLSEVVPTPSRSRSLPHEQSSSETKKVFARAASFQPDGSNAARHVHPKLPDYDDLAARFAALKGR